MILSSIKLEELLDNRKFWEIGLVLHQIRNLTIIKEIKKRLKGKVVIVCIGNELKGDDGAGPALAKFLEGDVKADVINCEEVPEIYTDKIKELKPDTIIIVDAVDVKEKAGSVVLIDKNKLEGERIYTTHNIPLKVFVDYLSSETKANVFIIGIQPLSLELGKGLSKEVRKTLKYLKDIFIELLKEINS